MLVLTFGFQPPFPDPPDPSEPPLPPPVPSPPIPSDPPTPEPSEPPPPPPPEPSNSEPPVSSGDDDSSSVIPSSVEPSAPSSVPPTPSSSSPSRRPSPRPPSPSVPDETSEPPPLIDTVTESITSETVSFTTVTTSVDGRLTTFTSAVTALADPSTRGVHGDPQRTALIAGLSTGLVALLLILLGGAYAYMRQVRRRQQAVIAAEKKRKETKNLLDGEGFYDDDDPFLAMRSYGPSTPLTGPAVPRTVSPTPSPIRSRASESGSIFREDVWPPPQDDLVDPIYKQSSQVNLSRIVDEVMGPSTHPSHGRSRTESTLDSMTSMLSPNDRRHSTESFTPSFNSYVDPFRTPLPSASYSSQSNSNPFAASRSSLSFLPDGAGYSPVASTSATGSAPASPVSLGQGPSSPPGDTHSTPPPISGSAPYSPSGSVTPRAISPTSTLNPSRLTAQPKKSSPLARALTEDAKILLGKTRHSPPHPPE
ncbi:hypothetical protein CC1G_02208 [Coprinopsis cinerea okayama7|uniref:Uncharacterized protein n=1 Tax=Coprinopsis cinerea (strain Okayama-7 / 130 / ATCC MYA-4618 / FGSC 9003) TaxID=240176 RepID=A8NKK0_COPC7|nr:hypothetical protein CC1G_02208 [Coprinopsis cinerea okayama7\|eukprot:XP_001834472.2 hypothetical protein CC1G_02208 [Coprinopsis cinerea okayama7\